MKNTIYYFSATGNSLKISRDIASGLGESDLVPINGLSEDSEIRPESGIVGIISPVYACGLPVIVANFIKKLNISDKTYVFAVANCGMIAGDAIGQVKRILNDNGYELDSGFVVKMPDNYLIFSNPPEKGKISKILLKEEEKVRKINLMVKNREKGIYERSVLPVRAILTGLIYPISVSNFSRMDKYFHADKKCNSCGICAEVCPVNNIKMSGGRPLWKHKCEQCLACIHWCPQEAIQFGRITFDKNRYRNLEITMQDIIKTGKNTV